MQAHVYAALDYSEAVSSARSELRRRGQQRRPRHPAGQLGRVRV